MGRKGSRLIPFLKNALLNKKYPNLKYEHVPSQAFSLNLPQKSSRLDTNCQHILKDWYQLTGRIYTFNIDYTQGKQGMEAALRRSDFLRNVQSGRKKKLIYRMLNDEEVREKKLSKKILKKVKKSNPLEGVDYAPSPESSGYGSGSDAADEGYDITNHALLHALKHDHEYEYTIDDYILGPENCTESDYDQEMKNYPTDKCPQELENISCENYLSLADLLPFEQWSPSIAPEPQIKSSIAGDANFNSSNLEPLQEIGSVENNFPLLDEIDFEQLFTDEDILQYGNSSDFEELCQLNEALPPDLDTYAVKDDVSTQNFLDLVTYKTQICKVYECRYRQDLPGMIILTCEPKVKEFCVSSASIDEPSSSTLIFDEGTMKLMSSCLFEGIKYLANDHILVFLKCKELVN